jgi:hypothetical protein
MRAPCLFAREFAAMVFTKISGFGNLVRHCETRLMERIDG